MGAVWPFLAQEREFLRSLASMVQDHAEGIKRQVREVQEESKVESAAGGSAPATSQAAPSPTGATGQKAQSAWTATAATPAPSTSDRPSVVIPPTPVDTPSQKPAAGKPSEENQAEPGPAPGDKGSEEPSLRELFWGDED